jgi:hypothetical protein
MERKLPSLEKHAKYRSLYQPNTLYWGLGIEHEVYLELGTQNVKKQTLCTHHNPERYSHDYIRQSYKPGVYEAAISEWMIQHTTGNSNLVVPLLMKSHSFLKTDVHNEHSTVYSKTTPSNPKFSGYTLLESLQNVDPYFVETLGKEWIFDGDTIEFNTLSFFNTTLDDMLEELATTEQTFEKHLNAALASIPDKHPLLSGDVRIMRKNHAFAMYLTNMSNINMFNNGTLHFNLTLPTPLDASCNIVNLDEFQRQHKRAIHAIQWIEPLLVAVYGSPDPFSALDRMPHCFSKASQRCAVSRYVSVGTYDTDGMIPGKCNTIPLPAHAEQRWFPLTYLKLPEIGLDINYRKHHNHGIELRFLDHIEDPTRVREVWILLIYLMDHVLLLDSVPPPSADPVWIEMTRQCLIHGPAYILTESEERALCTALLLPTPPTTTTRPVGTILHDWTQQWTRRFNRVDGDGLVPVGPFSQHVLKRQPWSEKCVAPCCPMS